MCEAPGRRSADSLRGGVRTAAMLARLDRFLTTAWTSKSGENVPQQAVRNLTSQTAAEGDAE